MDVDDHDAAVARVSHLPHLLSVLMAGHLTTVPEGDLVLAGTGLRDVTRVAASDPGLWEQIVGANSAAVLNELRGVQDQLDLLVKAVEAMPAAEELRGQLERGVAGTRKIPGKHGAAARGVQPGRRGDPRRAGRAGPAVRRRRAPPASTSRTSRSSTTRSARSATWPCRCAPEASDDLVARMVAHGWSVV